MRKYSFLFTLLLLSASSFAQNKDFSYKFYGQVRTDLYYNSRANEETVDGLFYMYPKDKIYDTDGKDLNATANGSFYTLYTRLGVDVQGPKLGRAKTSAKVEMDFAVQEHFLYRSPAPCIFELRLGKTVLAVGTNLASAVW